VTSNCVLNLAGPDAGRCIGLAKRLGTKCCPRARCVISAEVSAQLLQALLDLLHCDCDAPSLVPTYPPSTLPAGKLRPRTKCGAWKLSRDRATQTDTDTDLLCFAGIGNLDCEPLSYCLVLCGLGVRVSPHRALGRRALAPVHLVAPSLCPEKNLVRACASSPEIFRGGHGILLPAVTQLLALSFKFGLLGLLDWIFVGTSN
jgi:hypothetical protein